jgi:hypothetical protein
MIFLSNFYIHFYLKNDQDYCWERFWSAFKLAPALSVYILFQKAAWLIAFYSLN